MCMCVNIGIRRGGEGREIERDAKKRSKMGDTVRGRGSSTIERQKEGKKREGEREKEMGELIREGKAGS